MVPAVWKVTDNVLNTLVGEGSNGTACGKMKCHVT
jgi:hypothetical protein